jgi:UDP:flavonoid glycosyltransferase YjiC (YdhE family)
MKLSPMKRIAAFITPHGFGHTTRAIAVLETLQHRCPGLAIEIFTTVAEHLFRESLENYTIHQVVPDIGIIQHDALNSDLPATIEALDRLLPFSVDLIQTLAEKVQGCSCILCDIAPLGIVVAEAAGIPSVLVENFTWDWIYQSYAAAYPELGRFAETLAGIYGRATIHIQTEPICNPSATAHECPTIFRQARALTTHVLQQLGIADQKLILISLGGFDFTVPHWQQLDALDDCFFVLAGQPEYLRISHNCLALPHQSGFYHPDLIQAADMVIFKSGYSTIAECLQGGTRAVCIARPSFPESAVLAKFVKERLGGIILDEDAFLCGSWITRIPDILALPSPPPATTNGADTVAELLLALSGS